jgi:hypothetical protein
MKSVGALKLPHRGLGISAEVAIALGTQQAQAGECTLQAADIGATVTEPQRSWTRSSVLVGPLAVELHVRRGRAGTGA